MTTSKVSGIVILLVCSVVIAAAERPWFCHELDCPKFTVSRKNEFYETRIYTKGKVACYWSPFPDICNLRALLTLCDRHVPALITIFLCRQMGFHRGPGLRICCIINAGLLRKPCYSFIYESALGYCQTNLKCILPMMAIWQISAIVKPKYGVLQRLFDYIGGQNEPNVKINMTAPVVTKVEHGDGPFCKSNFTVSFFVPFADQVLYPSYSR